MGFLSQTTASSYLLLLLLSVVSFCLFCEGQNGNCYNGVIADGRCRCYQGWTGNSCEHCVGRSRLENSNGTIVDHFGRGQYSANRRCLFFIEADRPASSLRLRFNWLSVECQWDYLYVFDGDSVYAPKIAAFTGNILPVDDPYPPVPTAIPVRVNSTNVTSEDTSGTESGSGFGVPPPLSPYQDPTEVTITSSGPRLLLYFYTDVGAQDLGFNLSYWVDYMCPDNCSGRGDCDESNGGCSCHPGWRGEACQLPACPNDCYENGTCNSTSQQCSCYDGYTGIDCSISIESPRWEVVDYSISPDTTQPPLLARASHSAVLWGEYMVVYGGYRFPQGEKRVAAGSGVSGSGMSGSGVSGDGDGVREGSGQDGDGVEEVEVLRYHFASRTWEVLEVQNDAQQPQPRYGHSAVVYNDTLYVFGGAKIPQEEITDELWALDLVNPTWTPLFNDTVPLFNDDLSNMTSLDQEGGATASISMVTGDPQGEGDGYLPMPVRSHTAHVVGSRMVVLFGYSSREDIFISYVQEYDFETSTWSAPDHFGLQPAGRMGHSSVYNPESGLVVVYGGKRWRPGSSNQVDLSDEVLVYDPFVHTWSRLTASGFPRYLHSATLFGSLMLVYGGCDVSQSDGISGDCFSKDLLLYNTVCDKWQEVEYLGLPGNAGRYGHSALLDPTDSSLLVFGGFQGTLFHDLLRLNIGNCSVHTEEEECLNASALCAWSPSQGQCVSAGKRSQQGDLVYQCSIDLCLSPSSCSNCSTATGCIWNNTASRCVTADPSPEYSLVCLEEDSGCHYTSCESCQVHGCFWGGSGGDRRCLNSLQFNESDHELVACTSNSCFAHSSCSECTADSCLWCPSLRQCVPSYPYTYIYGQCLGWVNGQSYRCPVECADHRTCSSCQDNNADCGWCNDLSDTGLGVCAEGGFLGARNETQCPVEQWYFDTCPACQCNGHSGCVNSSVCEQCRNNTTGEHCEHCARTFYGNSENGGTCTPCNCNGYNPTCDSQNGSCQCLDSGVTGDRCDRCDTINLFTGDANNFCHYRLQVGYIYTFGATDVRERQSIYTCTPQEDKSLNFKFDISSNPQNQPIMIQLFLGRRSQDLWVLVNLTDQITLRNRDSFDRSYNSFQSNKLANLSDLFSFARPSLRASPNFTALFNDVVENDFTSHMWDRDVTLVIYLYNLTSTVQYKITVDQTDLFFVLYFFATFISCFSILLLAFLIGWYVKRKMEIRALIRAQYIELQRRVSRPFAKVKLVIDQNVDVKSPQNPSYTAVETCTDSKAAILTLLVHLPGEERTGRPAPGRTGLSFGSTLVKVNPAKLKSKEKTRERRRDRNRSHSTSVNSA